VANFEHVAKLKEGVESWNEWRRITGSEPNLSGAYLPDAQLQGANLRKAYLVGAKLEKANLISADLTQADLSSARLAWASIAGATLGGADLTNAVLYGVNLTGAQLCRASVRRANLQYARLLEADLTEADLVETNLIEADLGRANLSGADLTGADLTKANLRAGRMFDTTLNQAILDEARLWETQRAGWSIKGIRCKSAYWDEFCAQLTTYGPGEFEKLHSEQPCVNLFYKDGLTKFELHSLPALLERLATVHQGCTIRLKSLQETAGGATVSIIVEDADSRVVEEIRAEAQRLQSLLLAQRERIAQLETEKRIIWDEVFPRMLASTQSIQISGSTGVIIATGHATINQTDVSTVLRILDEVSRRQAELALSKEESEQVAEAIRTVRHEAQTTAPIPSKLQKALEVFKFVAAKVATKALENAVPEHLWQPLHDHVLQLTQIIGRMI
jgi:uncharacterized protein YjbI with pentapeptide repeats